MSRSLIAVIALSTVSTFTSDIAHAVSRGLRGGTESDCAFRRPPGSSLPKNDPP